MFARVSTYSAPDADKLLEGFDKVKGQLEGMEGFSHAYFLVDRAEGKGLSMTLWESEAALEASVAKAEELRRQGVQVGGGSVDSVTHYEVGMTAGRPVAAP